MTQEIKRQRDHRINCLTLGQRSSTTGKDRPFQGLGLHFKRQFEKNRLEPPSPPNP